MIQDAHPVRSGVPDCYRAMYRIECTTTAIWSVILDRFPSGFTGANVAPNPERVRTAQGLGTITFPAGMKVRGANANYSPPSNADASQRTVHVCDIDEAAGTANLVLKDDTGAIVDPIAPTAFPAPNDSWILVELTLETV